MITKRTIQRRRQQLRQMFRLTFRDQKPDRDLVMSIVREYIELGTKAKRAR